MGKWVPESKTHVSSMEDGDFYSHEKSVVVKDSPRPNPKGVLSNGVVASNGWGGSAIFSPGGLRGADRALVGGWPGHGAEGSEAGAS